MYEDNEARNVRIGHRCGGPAGDTGCHGLRLRNDAMQFNVKSLQVPSSCKSFDITLKHVGKLPKAAMGHNVVITKTADMAAVAKDGISAGVSNDYLKPGDSRVLANSKLIGGGESDTLTLDVGKLAAGESYSFFCSFPGHASMMKGSLKLSQ